jgi:hypothetical protein
MSAAHSFCGQVDLQQISWIRLKIVRLSPYFHEQLCVQKTAGFGRPR